MAVDRQLPYPEESAAALLGSILIDPQIVSELPSQITAETFYRYKHRVVYMAMMALHSRQEPIDFVTLTHEIKQCGKLDEIGGEDYIIGLLNIVPTSSHARTYADHLVSAHYRRNVIIKASAMASLAYSEEPDEQIQTSIGDMMLDLTNGINAPTLKTLKQIAQEQLEVVESRGEDWTPGIPTGLKEFDALLGGWHLHEYTIIAGRPGMGKTALADGSTLFASRHGVRTGWIDLEMGHSGKFNRFVASQGRMNTRVVAEMTTRSEAYPRYLDTVGQVAEYPVFIDSIPTLSAASLHRKITYMVKALGTQLIFIDYLQLVDGEEGARNQSRERELARVSQTIKGLCLSLPVSIVALVQLNRNVEHRADKRPIKSDLSGSGAFEQDAHNVVLIYRDDYYNPETSERPNVVELNLDKNRNGPTGVAEAFWDAQSARFCNLNRVTFELPKI